MTFSKTLNQESQILIHLEKQALKIEQAIKELQLQKEWMNKIDEKLAQMNSLMTQKQDPDVCQIQVTRFPTALVPLLAPFLDVEDFLELRACDFLGERMEEELIYPYEVKVFNTIDKSDFYITESSQSLSRYCVDQSHRFPQEMASGFSRLEVHSLEGTHLSHWDNSLLIPSAQFLVSLHFDSCFSNHSTFQETATEINLPKLKIFRLSGKSDISQMERLCCPVLEELRLDDLQENRRDPVFIQRHSHLIKRLGLCSMWFQDSIEMFLGMKNLKEINVVCPKEQCFLVNYDADLDIDYAPNQSDPDYPDRMSWEEFFPLPTSITFQVDEGNMPKNIRHACQVIDFDDFTRDIVTFNIEDQLNTLRRDTGFSVFTFTTFDPLHRVYNLRPVYQDDVLFVQEVEYCESSQIL